MRTPVVDVFASTSFSPRGTARRRRGARRCQDDGEDPQPELVHEVVREQGLDQVAAPVYLDLGAILLLEAGDRLGGVALEQDRVLPLDGVEGPGRDVLRRLVEDVGPLLLGRVRPVGSEDLVGLAPEQQVEGRLVASPITWPMRSSQ